LTSTSGAVFSFSIRYLIIASALDFDGEASSGGLVGASSVG
jgi:hypothetical protein